MPVGASTAFLSFDVSRGTLEHGLKLEEAAVRARDALLGFLSDGGENVVLLIAFSGSANRKKAWLSVLLAQYLLKCCFKRPVLLRAALGRAFQPPAAPADFLCGMALVQQDIDIAICVHHAALVQRHGAPGKAHGGQAIILGNYHVAFAHEIDQREIHAVGTFGNRDGAHTDLERGVKGSTAEHLGVVEYKVEQERQRLSVLTEQAEEKAGELDEVEKKIEKVQPVPAQIAEINVMGRKKRFGEDYELTVAEMEKLKQLAKYGITAQSTITDLERQLTRTSNLYWREKDAFEKLYTETQPFRDAMRLAPQRMREMIRDIFQQAKEAKEQRKARQQTRYR